MDFNKILHNFLHTISDHLPGVIGAIAVLIVGWLIAKGLSKLAGRVVSKSGLESRINKSGTSSVNIAGMVRKLVYYLLMVIVLLVVLELLGAESALHPLKEMLAEFTGFLPNLIAAGIIGFVGYTLATIVKELVGLASGSIEGYAAKMGMTGELNVTNILKQLVFLIVFIPLLIVAIDTLQMKTLSDPATSMLSTMMNSIPNIIAAVLIIGIFFLVGKYVTQILSQLLKNLGVDSLPAKIGIQSMIGEGTSMSKLLGNVAFFFIMFFGVITGLEKLHFAKGVELLNNLMEMSGQIFFGMIIMIIGNFIAGIAADAVGRSQKGGFLSMIVRFAVLGLFLAIALRTMGIANEIVELAFGLTLGAIAVAVALSFGLGGREAAGRQMEHILRRFREDKDGQN